MAAPSSHAGATRCAGTVLLASLVLLLLAAAARGGGVGEPADRPDAARGAVGGPMDCFMTCSTQLVGYIMTTIQCYNKCIAGGGGGGAEPLRRVLCDAHAAELSRLGYCSAHRWLADAGDMCEDCAAAGAPGKALLSWMSRSELGERDLACACCGVALESGFYSPPFLLPTPAARGSDCGHKEEEETARPNGDVVFVSEEGPVIELFDEKPLLGDDSINVLAQGAEIVANFERLVPLESIDSLADDMASVSSQYCGERKEAVDHVRQNDAVTENKANANEEKIVLTSDDDKGDGVVDRLIDEQIADVALVSACMEGTFDDGINAGETIEGFGDHQCKSLPL